MRVMVFGTFDDLHPGHRYLLSEAQKRGLLHVIVARDSNVMRIKGRAPLQTEDVRMQNIQDHFIDAKVMLGHESDFFARIREVKPDLILLGYDQKLPPGVTEESLGVPIERLDAFEPHIHKSSLRRARG
jgi:FAD synthetase